MATSNIKMQPLFVTETKTIPITWASTSNPSWYSNSIDISKDGYMPIAAAYNAAGTLGSFVSVSGFRILSGGNKLYAECRMQNQTPASTTQNSLVMTITYVKQS